MEGGGEESNNTDAIVVRWKNRFAGVVPVVLKYVRNVLLKINGVSAMAPPGFVRIVNGSTCWNN